MHFKFKFDSENDHGVLTIFLNDSESSAADRGGGGGGGQQGQFAPGPQCEGAPNDAELFQIRSR